MRLYHPAYERKRDRVTGVQFDPALLDRARVATADVEDPRQIESLLARGFLPWPDQKLEGAPAAPSSPQAPAGSPKAASSASANVAPLPSAEEVDGMTVAQLRALASELAIELPAKATKAELRALIRTPY